MQLKQAVSICLSKSLRTVHSVLEYVQYLENITVSL